MRHQSLRHLGCLALLLLALPQVAIGQDKPIHVDEAKIATCIESVEMDKVGRQDHDISARRCTFLDLESCKEGQGVFPAVAAMFCAGAELEVWQRLLKQAYASSAAAIALDDENNTKAPMHTDPVLPGFVEAHEAWQAFTEAQCRYEHLAAREGMARFYGYAECAVPRTASRLLLYRELTRAIEGENQRRRQYEKR